MEKKKRLGCLAHPIGAVPCGVSVCVKTPLDCGAPQSPAQTAKVILLEAEGLCHFGRRGKAV